MAEVMAFFQNMGGTSAAVLFLGWVLFDLRRDVKELKKNIVEEKTCGAHRAGFDTRLARIERAMNGALKRKGRVTE